MADNDVLTRATAYWSELRGGRRMATRDAFEAGVDDVLARHLIVSTAAADAGSFRHERAGKAAAATLRATFAAGRAEPRSPAVEAWLAGLAIAAASRAPHFATLPGPGGPAALRAVYLPLAARETSDRPAFVLTVIVQQEP